MEERVIIAGVTGDAIVDLITIALTSAVDAPLVPRPQETSTKPVFVYCEENFACKWVCDAKGPRPTGGIKEVLCQVDLEEWCSSIIADGCGFVSRNVREKPSLDFGKPLVRVGHLATVVDADQIPMVLISGSEIKGLFIHDLKGLPRPWDKSRYQRATRILTRLNIVEQHIVV